MGFSGTWETEENRKEWRRGGRETGQIGEEGKEGQDWDRRV